MIQISPMLKLITKTNVPTNLTLLSVKRSLQRQLKSPRGKSSLLKCPKVVKILKKSPGRLFLVSGVSTVFELNINICLC